MSNTSIARFCIEREKTHLIFDFDATIVLIHADWPKLAEALQADVMALDADLWARQPKGRSGPLLRELVEEHGEAGLDILFRTVPEFELQYKDNYSKNEPLIEEIKAFRDRYHLYIWSANSRELVEDVLRQLGMQDWFEKIIARNDVRHAKPYPDGFALIRDEQVPLERYVLIGDSKADGEAAAAAGIDFYLHDFFERGR